MLLYSYLHYCIEHHEETYPVYEDFSPVHMKSTNRRVIVLEGDPMVQEGLRLLLLDLRCKAYIVHSNNELQKFFIMNIECPQLIIAPIALESSESSEQLITKLRTHYNKDIPVILLDNEQSFEVININESNNIYFSDGSNPKHLRKNITDLLN